MGDASAQVVPSRAVAGCSRTVFEIIEVVAGVGCRGRSRGPCWCWRGGVGRGIRGCVCRTSALKTEVIHVNGGRSRSGGCENLQVDFSDVRHAPTGPSGGESRKGNVVGRPSGAGCDNGVRRRSCHTAGTAASPVRQDHSYADGCAGSHVQVQLQVTKIIQVDDAGRGAAVLGPIPTDLGVIGGGGPVIGNIHPVGPCMGRGRVLRNGGVPRPIRS